MNAGQYEGLMARLGEILDRMPEPQPTTAAPEPSTEQVKRTGWPYDREGPAPVPTDRTRQEVAESGAATALTTLLQVLDGWIEGARENHDGLGHRGENPGRECWTQFHPADIRSMVNDAARELGLAEFPAPANPKEDEVR